MKKIEQELIDILNHESPCTILVELPEQLPDAVRELIERLEQAEDELDQIKDVIRPYFQ